MKKLLLMAFAAVFTLGASAQHLEWDASQIPQSVEEAQALASEGWQTVYAEYPVTPENYILFEGNGVTAKFEKPTLIGNKCNYSTDYTLVPWMGMNNSDRNGIESLYFYEGLENNDYVRTNGPVASDIDGTDVYYTDAIVTLVVSGDASYGTVKITYSRGDNLSAMYVVDGTAHDNEGMMVLQSQTRNEGAENVKQPHVAQFGVVPGHTYYIMASEKQSVELYHLEYTAVTDDSYETLISSDDYPVYWDAASIPQSVEDAQALASEGWQTIYAEYPVTPANYILCEGEGITAKFENTTLIGNKCNYSTNYSLVPWMGMNNSARDGLESLYFYEGLENNDYVRYNGPVASDIDGSDVTYYDAVVTLVVADADNGGQYGRVAINYSRGDNLSAMYVIDGTANDKEGMMVLESQTRNDYPYELAEGESNPIQKQAHTAQFGVVPGHTYYIMASEKQSVELYKLGYCPVTSEKYAGAIETGIQNITAGSALTTTNNRIYSIDGRYVGTEQGSLSKGLYIMNGKKI
ncbi:MAG: hypothetical protein LUC91_05635, partial [Prevotella sp.]|nr:hypothetical protein [Prevotella sp.]